ncbi:MAG: hypothetical protein CMG61_06005 [Candidatus Marinimicrobia bacterium]|nr:hypothetical protein [Candidatus Neomarinimicrobiota bacterium]|tara:strand:- start:36488 stop:36895 length:408 start_codon:yes stop_codon:yes gene_type:complete
MKIKNMRQPNEEGQWGKVKAYFDVENGGFEIKGFRLVEGINGLFVSMPSRKGTDENGNDKWFDTVWIESKNQREELNTIALSEFNNTGSSDGTTSNNMNMQSDATSGENIKSDNITSETNNDSPAPAFSDDDIPF